MGKLAAQGARTLVEAMRQESAAHTSRNVSLPALGYVRRIGANIAIQIAGRELVLQSDELLILDSYTPVRGDKVLLVPINTQKWCVIGKFVDA